MQIGYVRAMPVSEKASATHVADRVHFVSRVRDIVDLCEQWEFFDCLAVGWRGYMDNADNITSSMFAR